MVRPSFVARLVVLMLAWLLATSALTYAAARRITVSAAKPLRKPVVRQERKVLVVPDVRRQAYVFAKGILGDAGFAWTVQGAVQGYAANTVATQSPLPGTRVVDTGAPTLILHLARGSRELGQPENASPYRGTALQLADLAVAPVAVPRTAKPAPKPKPRAKPAPAMKHVAPAARPPLFHVAGATPEPLDELPLPLRAQNLVRWLDGKPKPTDANVRHWLYQHEWIVAGASMGWSHGDEALKTLIQADRRVWALWGVGARSETIARSALAAVQARVSP